ncbi:MAG: hypothetical protein RR416_05550 [Clostridia bacterium]
MFIYFYAAIAFVADFFESLSPIWFFAIFVGVLFAGGLAQLVVNAFRYRNGKRYFSLKALCKKSGEITSFNKRQFARKFAAKFNKKIRKEMNLFLQEDKNYKGSLVNSMIVNDLYRKRRKSKVFAICSGVYLALTMSLLTCLGVGGVVFVSLVFAQALGLTVFYFINILIECAMSIVDEYFGVKVENLLAEKIKFGSEAHKNIVDMSKLNIPLDVVESGTFAKLSDSVQGFLATKPNVTIAKMVFDAVKKFEQNYVFSNDEKLSYNSALESLEKYC